MRKCPDRLALTSLYGFAGLVGTRIMPLVTNASANCSLTLVWTRASDEALCAAFTAQVNHSHSHSSP